MHTTWRLVLSALVLVVITTVSCRSHYIAGSIQGRGYSLDSSIASDSAIVRYYQPYKQQLDSVMNSVIGFSDQALAKTKGSQSLAGNFFVEGLLWKAQQLDKSVIGSFATKGGIRGGIPSGDVTVRHIFEMMPFENAITILTLTGSDMLVLGEFIARTEGQPIAGFEVRIKDRQLVSMRVQGKDINPLSTYKIATYDYLANGGDYVDFLNNPVQRVDYPERVREALMDYVKNYTTQGKHIQVVIDDRINSIQ